MPLKTLAKFEVKYLQILNEKGVADKKLLPKLTKQQQLKMYELMVVSRRFDEKALSLQRQGRIGTYASIRGQEAAQVGPAFAMEKNDWLFPAFREAAAYIARGHPMHMIYQYWGGDERGEQIPKDQNNFTVSIPVGSHLVHAVGAAMAAKHLNKKTAALVFFGDGATSEGDFHEALNFAGVFKAPAVFVCQNNQWAISVPVKRQTESETIAQKAVAYGFEGARVDGNDIFAVYKAVSEALKKAKQGKGPTLIECFTYRMGDHTTSDDSSKYRDRKEVEEWKKSDPTERFRKYLVSRKMWNEKLEKQLLKSAEEQVEEAVKKYESAPAPKPEDMFTFMFAEMPWNLRQQMEEAKRTADQK